MRGLTIGFPCKSVSSQNNKPKSFLDTTSPTGSGFWSMCQYLDYAQSTIEWVVTENARTMCFKSKQFDETPILIQNKAFEERGFIPIHSLVNTKDFGLPQSRTRCWGLYLKKSAVKMGMDPAHLLATLMRKPVGLDKVMVSGDGPVAGPTRGASGKKWKPAFEEIKKEIGKATEPQASLKRYLLIFCWDAALNL